jgi:hypothetical protein
VGCGSAETIDFELEFTTENSHDIDQQVLPTFAIIIGSGGPCLAQAGDIDWTRMVHGSQAIRLFKPIAVEGTIAVTDRISAIWDKGPGKNAVIEVTTVGIDKRTGEKVLETVMTFGSPRLRWIWGAARRGGGETPTTRS